MVSIAAVGSFAAEKASGKPDAAVERTRQEVKMLDDLFKNAIVLIDGHYVKTPSDLPAATAAKALWAALKKDGWYVNPRGAYPHSALDCKINYSLPRHPRETGPKLSRLST